MDGYGLSCGQIYGFNSGSAQNVKFQTEWSQIHISSLFEYFN